MAQGETQKGKGGRYIVIASVETEYEDCSVIPPGDYWLPSEPVPLYFFEAPQFSAIAILPLLS